MKKFVRLNQNCSTLDISTLNIVNKFQRFKIRYKSPFKPRAPTPPKLIKNYSKSFNKTSLDSKSPSLDSSEVYVLQIPFDSNRLVNQTFDHQCPQRKKPKRKTINLIRPHKRSGSVIENFQKPEFF